MNTYFNEFLLKIEQEEQKVTFLPENCIKESLQMMSVLSNMLKEMKTYILTNGFESQSEEISFFRDIKPIIQGKLLFYRQIHLWEKSLSFLPKHNSNHKSFLVEQEKTMEQKLKKSLQEEPFYNYYLSENHQWDAKYFVRYQVDIATEILPENRLNFDTDFSTYYDFLVAQILCKKQLNEYLTNRIEEIENNAGGINTNLEWTATKNDLIELVYALQQVKAISSGKMSINKIVAVFSKIFNIELKDTHHAFHRMKTRGKSRTTFLDKLKIALEEYMDKE